MAPINDWMLSVVRVDHKAKTTPAKTAGTAEDGNPGEPRRLEIGRQQQEDHEHGHHQSEAQSLKHLPQRDGLSADIDGDAARRLAGPLDRRGRRGWPRARGLPP